MWYYDNSNGYERGEMQILHLGFQLHCPFGDEDVFQMREKTCYQPFFAFLERNAQKYPNFRVSLQVSGVWIELAERLDPELILRLRKLVQNGNVEVLATPYYYSLSFFYDRAEFEAEVWLFQEKMRDLFGIECPVLAHPDLIYNDALAKWANANGFRAILAGTNNGALRNKSENYIYDAAECQNLQVLCRNSVLSDLLMLDARGELGMMRVDELAKRLELESLRGSLLNLFLDAEIFCTQRTAGVIGLLDDLMAMYLKKVPQPVVTASNVLQIVPVKGELSQKRTASWRNDFAERNKGRRPGIVLLSDVEDALPEWLSDGRQQEFMRRLCELKPEVFRTEDDGLIADFCRLMVIDQVYALGGDVILKTQALRKYEKCVSEVWQGVMEEMDRIRRAVAERWAEKKVEIERRGNQSKVSGGAVQSRSEADEDEGVEVAINFVKKPAQLVQRDESVALDEDKGESEIVEDEVAVPVNVVSNKHTQTPSSEAPVTKRVLRRLVIE